MQELSSKAGKRYARTMNSCISLDTPLELVFSLKLVEQPQGAAGAADAAAGESLSGRLARVTAYEDELDDEVGCRPSKGRSAICCSACITTSRHFLCSCAGRYPPVPAL